MNNSNHSGPIQSNGIELYVEQLGDTNAPAILLIAGLGEQLGEWSHGFCDLLIESGFQVIRFDNRDVGLSEKIDHQTATSTDTYTLNDMSRDALGVLDALAIDQAHIVGMSMGGMIAQILAANEQTRILSLCSIMSTSGRPGLPKPTPEVQAMLTKKTDGSRESFIENWVESKRLLDSPAYPANDAELYTRAKANCGRSFYPVGFLRQLNAIYSSGSRVELLNSISCPTMVIHGDSDDLIPHPCGADVAQEIKQAHFELISGMGHNLPAELLPQLSTLILRNIANAN